MMDVQSFISGLAGGVQKPIPTQEMRLFMQQQRAAGPPAAATVLQEPRVWAQQHHTQAQNSLPFHGCTNGAGSFQPFYPQHSGLSGDHASFHLNRQPATAIGVPWMSQCGMPNGQRANGYCLPNHYNNPIANSKPAVSNECRPTPLPAPATTTSPCVQARSVAGAGGSQSFEGRKSTSLENPWQDAPRTTSQIQREASPSFRHFDLKEPMAMMDANQPCQVYASQSSTPPSVTHIRHGTIPRGTPEYQDREVQYREEPHQQFQYPHPYQARPQTGQHQQYQYLPSYHMQNQQLRYLPSYEMRPADQMRHHSQLPHQKIHYFPAYRVQHQAEQFRHQNQTQQQTGQPQQFQYQHLAEEHQTAQNLHQTLRHRRTQNTPMNQTRYQAAQHQNKKQAVMREQFQLQRQYQMQRGQTAAPQSYHGVIRGVVPIELSQLRCPAGVQGQHRQDTRKPREADPVNMSSVVICKPTLAADRTLPRAQRIPGVLNQTECGRPQAPDTTPHRRLRSSSALPLQSSGSPDTPNSVLGASRRSLSSSGARTRMNQNDGSDWTAAQGDDSVKTAEQAPSGHGRLIESAVETLPSVNPPRPNFSSSTRLQSYEQCVSEESAGALAADTSGVTAGSRKPTMNAQRIAGSRRPAPRTCASVGTINPRNVSNIGEKYKDRLLSSNAERKCSRPEMRKSLWEANTKTRVCPTTSALPRSDIAAPVTANPTHKSKASPNSTVRGSALSGGRSRGNRGLNVRSSSKESEASDTKMLGEVKPPTAGALSTDQSRLAALSRAAVAPGKALPRGVQKNPSNPLLTSDSGRETALTEKIPPSRRGIPTLTRLELGKHSRSTDRRHSDLSASHGRLPPLSGKVDGDECDIGESYARRRRYSMLRRGTVSSPVSRLVSAEGNSRTAARSGTGTRPRPETVAERAPRRPGLNSILRNSNGTDSLKTRTFGARSGVLRAAASRKQSAGVPSGNVEGNRSRESSSTVGGRRLESGDSKSTGGTSRSTSSLESAVLPEVSLPQDDDTHSDLCGKVRDALLQGSGMEESRLENSVRFSRFESGLDEEPNIDEDEVVLSGHSDVTTGPFLGIEVLHEDRRHSKPASDSQTTCLHPDYRRTRSLPGEEEMKGGAALNETRMMQACGTVMPPNRKTQNSTMPAVMKDETTVQSTTPSEGAAMSERSTSVSRGGCSTPPRSVSDVSGPQTWEVSSAAVTPVVEDVVLDDASVTVVPGRTGAAAGVGITKQGLLREAPLVSDHEAICQPERDSATMSLDREAAEFTTGERRRETVSAVTEAAHVLTSNSCHVPGRESRGKINQAAGNPCRPGAVTHQQPGVEESAYYSQAQSDVLIASGAHHLSAPREQMSLPVEQNTAEITDQACAKRNKTPNEKGEVRPSTLSVESSAECAKDQQNPGIFPQAASKAPTGACVSPLEASASIPDSASAAAQHAQAEEQLRQQVRAKIEHKFRQLQDEQLRQHCLAQQQQQLLQQVNLRKKEALQQAEQRAQMVQQQIHTQKLGQGLVKVSQVQLGTSVTVPGPVNHQHPNLQRPAVHHLAGIAQPQGIGESAKSLTGYPNLRQLSGVHQEPQQRVVLRPAVSEQQLRRPTLSHSPARRAVPEQERRVGGETQQSNIASHEAAAGQARAAELQRRLEIVRETNILRAFYSSAEVRTPAFAVAAMEETHLDCHGDRDPHRPLRAPSAKGEPLSALARRYLHSQSLTASACHPTGRQEHEAFVRELWSEKHRTQQDELRRNLALYQQGRPNGLAAAGIDPAAAFNALRVSETAFQQPTAVSFVGPCPTAGAPLPMTGAGSIEEPFPLVAPSSLARPGPSPLSAGMCHLPMGDKGRADVSPMANLSRFVRERHVVAHPVVAVGNHVPM